MNKNRKISFVIPCYFSGKYLAQTTNEIVKVFEEKQYQNYEIILVNDGSFDTTFEEIKKLCESNDRIIGIDLAKNFGQANATIAAFAHVSGELVAYCDDDGQSPVDEIWKLINKLDEGHDLVFAKFKTKKNGYFQNVGTKINNMMASALIGKPKNLHMGNFWVAQRFVVDEIINCKNPYPYLAGLFLKTTNKITDVLTDHRARSEGKSNYTFMKMFGLWLNGFTAFSVVPLRAASLIGGLCSLVGFIFILVVIGLKFKYPNMPVGYSSLMSVILFIGGMIMLMLGIVGEYVGRIYININSIPQYVVRQKISTRR